jgi:hypothetical protein
MNPGTLVIGAVLLGIVPETTCLKTAHRRHPMGFVGPNGVAVRLNNDTMRRSTTCLGRLGAPV